MVRVLLPVLVTVARVEVGGGRRVVYNVRLPELV